MRVIMIPSASGGLGHIGRTAALARQLQHFDPSIELEYLLDLDKLRPFNIDAAAATGYRVNLLPMRNRGDRDPIVRACLGSADIVIEDTCRHLIALRPIVPESTWISVPMYPLVDELFMDWPLLAQSDGIVWPYPPALDFPPELATFADKLIKTGPFLDLDGIPDRARARRRLRFAKDERVLVYAPRGMTFGRPFGERVLAALVGAVVNLAKQHQVRLVLASVHDRNELRGPGIPDPLPECVTVLGPLAPTQMLALIRAADVAVTEGSNMTQEAAALGTPIMMIPGTIYESWLLGTRLKQVAGAQVLWIETVSAATVLDALHNLLGPAPQRRRMLTNALQLIAGGGGVKAAAQFVLDRHHERRRHRRQRVR